VSALVHSGGILSLKLLLKPIRSGLIPGIQVHKCQVGMLQQTRWRRLWCWYTCNYWAHYLSLKFKTKA